ncbi:MAG TPA: hypothetical protein VFV27_10825 [Nevskiaceae bacterium]|nr:hypothetical protein [Nevskiaceae bacterium]
MARKPKAKAQPEPAAKPHDEFVDEAEGGDEELPSIEPVAPAAKLRDWRDVEKFKELRELRKLVGEDLDFDLDDGKARRRA